MSFHEVIGQMYSVTFEEVVVSASQDLFTLRSPVDGVLFLNSVSISQSSDPGDTESEMLNIVYHRPASQGSGGTTIDDGIPLQTGDLTPGMIGHTFTAWINNTTQATKGTVLRSENFNVLAGYSWRPSLPERIVLKSNSVFLAISLETTPSDSLTLSGTIVLEELVNPSVGG